MNSFTSTEASGGNPHQAKIFHYYDLLMAAFVSVLLCSNLIGASKIFTVMGVTSSGSILFFPISYLFGDILTEVYGFKRSRKVVWTGFIALAFASLVSWVVVNLPPAQGWPHQAALETVFSNTPRLVFASLIAYFIGEFMNSYVMAKMKIWTQGKWLWSRIVGSTIIGEAVDTIIFYPLAFLGIWAPHLLIQVMIVNYSFKVVWEILMTPFTYRLVRFLKRIENEDYYDYGTNFTPFSLKT